MRKNRLFWIVSFFLLFPFLGADEISLFTPALDGTAPALTLQESVMVLGEVKSEEKVAKVELELYSHISPVKETHPAYLYPENIPDSPRTLFKSFIKIQMPRCMMAVVVTGKSGRTFRKTFYLPVSYNNQQYKSDFGLITTLDKVHKDAVRSLQFSVDGRYLISASDDRLIKVIEPRTLNVLKTFQGHKNYVRKAVITSDNRYVLSCSDDKTVKIWDFETGKELHTLQGHDRPVFSVAVSPNGKYAASAGMKVRLWDLEQKSCVYTIEKPISYYSSLEFSPDGKYLFTGDQDRRVTIYDVEGRCLKYRRSGAHSSDVLSIAVSPDNRYLYTGGKCGYLKWWKMLLDPRDKAWEEEDHLLWEMRLAYVKDRFKDPAKESRGDKVLRKYPVYTVVKCFYDDDDKFEVDRPYSGGDGDTDSQSYVFKEDCSFGQAIVCLSLNKTGEFLLVVLENGEMRVHETYTAIKRYDYDTKHTLQSGAFSSDGTMAAIASQQGKMWIFGIK